MKDSDTLTELQRIYKDGLNTVEPFEMTGTLKGRHSINQHLGSLFKKADKEIKIITTEEGLNELYANHYNSLKRLTKKGIKLRIISSANINAVPAKAFSEIAEMKISAEPLNRAVAIDDKHLVFSLTDGKKVHQTQDVAFWAQSQHAVQSLFEPVFKKKSE